MFLHMYMWCIYSWAMSQNRDGARVYMHGTCVIIIYKYHSIDITILSSSSTSVHQNFL